MKRNFRPGASFRKPTRTKIQQKINLMNCILHRERFTDADIASLAAGYGHSEAEVRAMVAEEMQRRAEREVRRGAA